MKYKKPRLIGKYKNTFGGKVLVWKLRGGDDQWWRFATTCLAFNGYKVND